MGPVLDYESSLHLHYSPIWAPVESHEADIRDVCIGSSFSVQDKREEGVIFGIFKCMTHGRR